MFWGVWVSHIEKTEILDPYFEPFANYLFLKKLAAGGMAEIFLARPATHLANGRVQVVKRILPHVANNPLFVRMFQTEIQVIMGFNHPHTVQLHDFGEINGQPYISMEYIEGKNLKDIIIKFTKRKQSIPIPMVLSLASQAAAGLSYAHNFVNKVTGEEVHAIHRDISPHNLIVSYEGNLKVIDFGIAKAASGMHEATRVGTLKGKISYMAPEQVTGQPLDARCDIFALGIVAWELLTLRRPFTYDAESDVTVLSRIEKCEQHVVPPSTYNSEVPPEVDDVIMKALRKNPKDRYSSAREFQVALRQVMLKYYPNYTYADTGHTMHELFKDEMEAERKEIRELNLQAQTTLSSLSSLSQSGLYDASKPGVVTGVLNNIKAIVPHSDSVELRLKNIENLMKQKSSGRFYMMFAFYLLSLLALKMDGKYNIVKMIMGEKVTQTPIVQPVVQKSTSPVRKKAVNKPKKRAQVPVAAQTVKATRSVTNVGSVPAPVRKK